MREPGTLNTVGLSISFGGLTALDGLSIQLPAGGIHGLIGPNGAGKTTFIDAVGGFLPQARGEVWLNGERVDALPPYKRARKGLGRTFQEAELFGALSIEENLKAAAVRRGTLGALADLFRPNRTPVPASVERAIELLGIGEIRHESPDEITEGQRKLVGLARALVTEPAVLLLDEPAAGLDTHETAQLADHLRAIAAEGITVLLIDHDMSLVLGICDQISVLDFGKLVVTGTADEIRTHPDVIAAYLGSDAAGAADLGSAAGRAAE
jgi:branched-chain amino acid transport system ATP-binding protein